MRPSEKNNTQSTMMNIFRMAGDFSHLASTIILLHAIETKKSSDGVSLKTQVLYTLVYLTRYMDLFFRYVSLYNSLMKLIFISTSCYVVYLMVKKYPSKTNTDNFRAEYMLAGCAVLAVCFNHKFTFSEVMWSFSVWLEAVAILPQLFMLQKSGEAQSLTVHYIFALGLYRALYIPNWIWRYMVEGKFDWIAFVTGMLQTLIYSDFFYIYYQKVIKNMNFNLPV